ncbi:MAG: glycosyltransferase [Alphaproteobacteria bacterium]|nr:glycosyltransferase [Alphaproteobacteria bacterium]
MSKVSIIIPMYKVEKYLRRCLDSVQNQTFKDWQAICVDDGSPDKSGEIAEEYAARDKRFVVLHKKNGGVSNARNVGVSKSLAEYIMFLDSDDCIHPQTLEILYNLATMHHVDIVSFRYDRDLYNKILQGQDVNKIFEKRLNTNFMLHKIHYKKTSDLIKFATERNHSWGMYKIRHCYPVLHLFKRDLIKNIKFNTRIKISEDFPFWTDVLVKKTTGIIIRTPLYFYIPNPMSALRSADEQNVFDNVSLATQEAFKIVMQNKLSGHWVKNWRREFLWPFIIIFMRSANKCKNKKHILKRLIEMNNIGMFDNPPTIRARKYKRRIENFISQIS